MELDNEQQDEIEQKSQAKTNKRATEWGSSEKVEEMEKKKITEDLKTVSPTEMREKKFFAEVKTGKAQALTPSVHIMTGNKNGHSSPSNLCSAKPKHKHLTRQQIQECQPNV